MRVQDDRRLRVPLAQSRPVRTHLIRLLAGAAVLVLFRVLFAVLSGYPDYFPPDFSSDFLAEREGHFFGWYRWAFATHLAAGPVALLAGLFLVAGSARRRWPRGHRVVGRIQLAVVLLLLVPSGLAMAVHARGGFAATVGFATLSLAMAITLVTAVFFAVRRDFDAHRRWAIRTFALLCSAVVARVIGGTFVVLGFSQPWTDPFIAWASWIAPLVAVEVLFWSDRQSKGLFSSPPATVAAAEKSVSLLR